MTDDTGTRTLRSNWRGIDKPTNVLSFPALHDRSDTKSWMQVRLSALGLKRSPKTDAQAGVIVIMKSTSRTIRVY